VVGGKRDGAVMVAVVAAVPVVAIMGGGRRGVSRIGGSGGGNDDGTTKSTSPTITMIMRFRTTINSGGTADLSSTVLLRRSLCIGFGLSSRSRWSSGSNRRSGRNRSSRRCGLRLWWSHQVCVVLLQPGFSGSAQFFY
jgi:hypothetical protein